MTTIITIICTAALITLGMLIAYRRGQFSIIAQRDHIDTPGGTWLTPRRTQEQLIREAQRHRRYLREHIDEECLRILEERFKTHLPAYQRTSAGTFDPIAAAHRDGSREVLLYIRQQVELAEHEAKQN